MSCFQFPGRVCVTELIVVFSLHYINPDCFIIWFCLEVWQQRSALKCEAKPTNFCINNNVSTGEAGLNVNTQEELLPEDSLCGWRGYRSGLPWRAGKILPPWCSVKWDFVTVNYAEVYRGIGMNIQASLCPGDLRGLTLISVLQSAHSSNTLQHSTLLCVTGRHSQSLNQLKLWYKRQRVICISSRKAKHLIK